MKPLLEVDDLTVKIGGKRLLSGINLTVAPGEIHVVFGPNGSGKSTLIKAIMGLPPYMVTSGDIRFQGKSILGLEINERAGLGIGLAFQQPPAVRGVSLSVLGKALGLDVQRIDAAVSALEMDNHLERGLNDGFSGGEQKRSELLQLLLQQPKLVLLDEPESGVDVDSLKLLTGVIKRLFQKDIPILDRTVGGMIVTHTGSVLKHLHATRGYILIDGRITCSGVPLDIFDQISEHGFANCVAGAQAKEKTNDPVQS
jgi:Fe-S cluster assembly ATP-binding protein